MIAVGFQSRTIATIASRCRRSTDRDPGAITSQPWLAGPLTMCRPRKPAPPVTKRRCPRRGRIAMIRIVRRYGPPAMPILHAIVLGLVQGLSEFLPISSSGHLVLTRWFLGWDEQPDDVEKAFDVALHFGTFVAVV